MSQKYKGFKRKNRTLQEMSRVMLHAKYLPKYFWVESIRTSCHITNRVYLRKNSKQTPYELWYGKKPNLKYLRTFGSQCYVCKDREHLYKFETRGDKAIFLGYSPNSRAYRIYNLRTKALMESINVIVSDTIIENKISESPIVVESENDFKTDYTVLITLVHKFLCKHILFIIFIFQKNRVSSTNISELLIQFNLVLNGISDVFQ